MWACVRRGRGREWDAYPPGREERDAVGELGGVFCRSFGRLRRARRGGGVQGVAERDVAAVELCSRVVARPGDAHSVFIGKTSSRGWWLHPGLEGSL